MRTTLRDVRRLLDSSEPIPMVTAYDYTSALLADRAGIPMILVGDSMAQTMLGFEDTLPVTVDDMVRHTAAVVRGTSRAFVVADMPFMSYQASLSDALRNAGRLLKEGGAQAVKLEGGASMVETVRALVGSGVAVMAHLGLTPQSVHQLGGYGVQARTAAAARTLLDDARALEEAGAFALVLELVPAELAAEVTEELSIPTIGIGAGEACDGQVQVWHDLLGLSVDFTPRHAKRYAEVGTVVREALERWAEDVRERRFPTDQQTSHLTERIDLGTKTLEPDRE
ncbi:MAG: 3-methyl-2-oxobutanoate hydroxymethyltransferase [Gemmatimonadota bacterium]|nr:3-methyl-2-oxobutanoate hydroxymethyltransferase [Gemmatimonadota bacterium]